MPAPPGRHERPAIARAALCRGYTMLPAAPRERQPILAAALCRQRHLAAALCRQRHLGEAR